MPQELPKVSVIIVSYNDEALVRRFLGNLREVEYPNLEVIVKDQDSQDATADIIAKEFPRVRLITGENVGLSAAYNTAYRSADSEYLLFLGMDAFPEENTISTLVDYFESHPDVGAATCKLTTADGSLDMDAHRAFPTPWISFTRLFGLSRAFPNSAIFNSYFLPDRDLNQPHEIDMCISHFMFVRREVLDEIGGFDEDYFLYGEDVDVCYRIKQAGWKIMYLPQCEALHLKGGSIGTRSTTRETVKKPLELRLRVQKHSADAMEIFLKKHYLKKYPRPLVYLMIWASRVLGKVRVLLESLR